MTIDDNSVEAQKIRDGYDYTIKNGKIKTSKMYTEPSNKWQLVKEVQKITNIPEIKALLVKMLEA